MLAPQKYRLALAVLASLLLSTFAATAQDAEARARDLNRDAMDEDYLATNFTVAIGKLEKALAACGKDKCSKDLIAKIHGNIGTVYAAGLSRHDAAVAAFKEMLRIDPAQTPNSAYVTGDVQKAFDEAKAAMGPARPPQRAVGVLVEKPWPEQATYHPVPVYVELPQGAEATRVVVRYKPPAQTEWKELTLQKHQAGWGGYIPCPAVEKKGELVYFTTAFDQNLDRIASAGSAERPRKVQLKTGISGRQPSLPQAVPPTPCPRPEERLSCETDDDCPGGDVCRELACVTPEPTSPEDEEAAKRKLNWLSIGFSPDLVLVSQTDDACSPSVQDDGKYSCFYAGGVPFDEQPLPSGSSNSVSGGVGTGSMRVLVGYDRVLGQRMTVGLRLGFAFLGYPERKDGKTFTPFHAEGRFAYHLLKDPFADKGVRPYLFAGGGYAEVAGRVSTKVVFDDGGTEQSKTVDVFQRAGNFFGGLGGGIQYAVSPQAAMVVELGGRVMFPEQAFVIAPKLGFAYGL
jgi:hypothetical protein